MMRRQSLRRHLTSLGALKTDANSDLQTSSSEVTRISGSSPRSEKSQMPEETAISTSTIESSLSNATYSEYLASISDTMMNEVSLPQSDQSQATISDAPEVKMAPGDNVDISAENSPSGDMGAGDEGDTYVNDSENCVDRSSIPPLPSPNERKKILSKKTKALTARKSSKKATKAKTITSDGVSESLEGSMSPGQLFFEDIEFFASALEEEVSGEGVEHPSDPPNSKFDRIWSQEREIEEHLGS